MLRTTDDALWDVRHGPLSFEPSLPSLDALTSDTLVVPSAHLLLYGDYARSGLDLLIQDGDDRLVIHDYFRPGRKPDLMAPDGAVLNAATIEAIAVGNGHETAQAGGAAPAPIGRVETVGGTASAIRNGVQVVLRPGELIYQGDTVQTDRGGSLAVIFVDGTTFSLSGSSRMVLNEMVYQAGATNNSSLMSLVSGSISFVAGQVAKTGDMRVDTPVATMGIRGTAVGWTQLELTTDGTTQLAVRPEKFVVSEEPDGRTGSFEIRSKATGQLLGVVSQNDRAVIVTPTGTTDLAVNEIAKTPADIATEQSIVRGLFGIIASAQPIPTGPGLGPQQPNPNPNPGTGPQNGGAPGSSTSPNAIGGDQPNPLSRSQDGTPPTPTLPTAPEVPPIASLGPTPPVPPTIVLPSPVGGAPTLVTATPAPVVTAVTVPALLGQTISLDQKEAVVAVTPSEGLLARPGVEPATLAAEKVVSAHYGTGPDVPVAQGTIVPTLIEGRYGTLGIRDDGTYAYVALRAATLHEGETGTDSFTYQTNDGLTQTIVFNVAGHNDAPVPTADFASANLAAGGGVIETTSRAAGVLGNDSDPDHDETTLLQVSAVSGPESGTASVDGSGTAMAKGHYGSLAIAPDGTWTYTPDDRATALPGPGHDGATVHELFTVTVVDPSGATATETLDIALTGVNDAPTAHADTASATTSGPLSVDSGHGLLANDTDPDLGDRLTVSAIRTGSTGPDHEVGANGTTEAGHYGSLTVFGDGSYRYEPDAQSGLVRGATATDSFTYTVKDQDGATSSAALSITVTGVNHDPVAAADVASVTDGTDPSTRGNLITGDPVSGAGRDSDQDGDALTVSALRADAQAPDTLESDGTYGHLTIIKSTGEYVYTLWTDVEGASDEQIAAVRSLGADEHRSEKFTYTVDDGHGGTASTTLTVAVTGTNDAPVAHDDTAAATTSGPLSVGAGSGLLANDTDPDLGDRLMVSAIRSDSTGPDHEVGPNGTTEAGQYGSLTIFADGSYRYDADAQSGLVPGETAAESFTYTVTDENGATSSAALSITVTDVNHDPVAAADVASVTDGTDPSTRGNLITGDPVSGAGQDSDPDGDALTVSALRADAQSADTLESDGTYGHLTIIKSTGEYFYTLWTGVEGASDEQIATVRSLGEDDHRSDKFTYTVDDGHGGTASTTLTVAVTGINDAPSGTEGLGAEFGAGRPNTPLDLLTGASDPDQGETETLQVTNVQYALEGGSYAPTAPDGVTLDGSHVSVDPADPAFAHLAAGTSTTISITFDITDVHGASTPGTAQIVVDGQNDRPVLDDVVLGDELAGSSDYAGQAISSLYADHSSDPDDGAYLKAIAVTGAGNPSEGTWQYSDDFGSTWTSIAAVSEHSALVLGASDELRFVPSEGFSGEATPLTVYGLDDTFAGAIHGTLDVTLQDGALSAASSTVGVTVDPSEPPPTDNTAPYLTSSNVAVPASGETVSELFASLVADPDSGAFLAGIAVIGNASDPASEGEWQYSTDRGAHWVDIQADTDADPLNDFGALALSADTLVRFLAVDGFAGAAPALTVRAIDDTYTSGFSNNNTAVLVYTAINDSPTPFSSDTAEITAADLIEAGTGTAGTAIATKAVDTPDGATVDPSPYLYPWQKLSPVESGGHSYVYVPVQLTWSEANALALSLGGHLATITSAGENDAVKTALGYQYSAFIGATDAGHEGHWNWVTETGPGEGANFWNGTYVPFGNGSVLEGGSGTVPGGYANWAHSVFAGIADEPNNLNGGDENVAEIYSDGHWNDVEDNSAVQQGFVLEYNTPSSAAPALYIASALYGNVILSASTAGLTLTYSLQNGTSFEGGGGSADSLPGGQVFTDTVSPPLVDANGNSVDVPVTFTIAGTNDAPRAFSIDAPYAEPGSDYALDLSEVFYDPDQGDSITLSVTNLPGWATFDPSTGQLSGHPVESDFGTSTVQVTATDSFGASTSLSFALVVDFAPAIVAPTNLAADPSFEDASVGDYAAGSGFAGWTVGDSEGSAGGGVAVRDGGTVDGALFVGLGQSGSVSQTLATVAGETYVVKFQLGSDAYSFGEQTVGLSTDGGHESTYAVAGSYYEQSWTPETFTFTATGDATVLTFQSRGDDPLVDAVAITPTNTAVGGSGHHVASGSVAFTDPDGTLDTHVGGTPTLPAGAITYLGSSGNVWDMSSLPPDSVAALVSAFHTGAVHEPDGSVAGTLDYTFDVSDQALGFLSAGETLVLSFDVPVVDAGGQAAHAVVPITIHGPDAAGSGLNLAADTVLATSLPADIPTEALLFNDAAGSHGAMTVAAVTSGATLKTDAALVETSSYSPSEYTYKAAAADGTAGLGTIYYSGISSDDQLTAPSGGAILLGSDHPDGSDGLTLAGGGGSDVFVLPYDPTGSSKAVTSLLQITGFDKAHDAFDLHDLTATDASAIDDYVRITTDGEGGAILAVSRDGSEPFQAQAHLDDVGRDDTFTVIWDHHVAQVAAHYASA